MNFKVSLRHLARNKTYAGLNVIGLSFGIASFLVIYIFIQNEMSYDLFHEKADRIYRVTERTSFNPEVEQGGVNAALVLQASEVLTNIEAFTRIESWAKMVQIPSKKDSSFGFNNLAVDQGFFDIFSLDLASGAYPDFDNDPNTAMISAKMADKFFPNGAVGQIVKVRDKPLRITGVFKDLPDNSSLIGDFVFPFEIVNAWRKSSFSSMESNYFDQSYVLLREEANAEELTEALADFYAKNGPDWVADGILRLQPLAEIHFGIKVQDSIGKKTDKQYIFIFTAVGMIILLSSFLNYLNMAVSQSMQRHKEIGLRKVLGANKWKVYGQFLTESFLLISLSLIAAVVMLEGIIPQLESLIDRSLDSSILRSTTLWIQAFGLIVLLTCLTALYPAWTISRPKATLLLKQSNNAKRGWLTALSTVQVVIFMVLVSVVFVSEKQLRFMQNENLGFQKEYQLFLHSSNNKLQEYGELLKTEFMANANVESVTMARSLPSFLFGSTRFRGYDVSLYKFPIGSDYFETMEMELLAGRDFRSTDLGTKKILLNETAVKQLNLGDDPVGQTLAISENPLTVIGVVADFHFMSKKEPIKPIMFTQLGENEGSMIVRLNGNNLMNTVSELEASYDRITGETLNYEFLDTKIEAQYKQEKIMITMIEAGTVMAAIVAFLGLFGISGYTTKRRLKEMGIRKVLGAGFLNIQQSLNRPGLIRLLIAALFSGPVIYYWMNDWLNSFAYRIDFPLGLVLGTLLLAGAITLFTALIHSIKAYLINPVEILKDE